MASREENIRLLSRLERLTREGRIRWKKTKNHPVLTRSGKLTSAVYEAGVEDVLLHLYRVDETRFAEIEGSMEYYTDRKHVLEIRDKDGDSIQEIEDLTLLRSFFDLVRSNVSGLGDKISRLMEKEPTHAQ